MKQIETQIIIDAALEKVWHVLTDFDNHPKWNPFIRSIAGPKIVGQNLVVLLGAPNQKPMTFKPVVLKFTPNKEFRWRGKLLLPGIFDGEHYFILEEISPYKTKFTHGEIFEGILVNLLSGMLDKTKLGFEAMNVALKNRCENV